MASTELEAEHEDARRKILEDAQSRFQVKILISSNSVISICSHFLFSNQAGGQWLQEL